MKMFLDRHGNVKDGVVGGAIAIVIVSYIVLMFCVGCTTVDKSVEKPPVVVAPPIPKGQGLPWKNPEWDAQLLESLAQNMTILDKATDMNKFCPRYAALGPASRIQAWGYFMVAIAKRESGWNPGSRYKEPAPLNVYSEGLFQMSVPECGLTPTTILQGPPNIRCAVVYMAKLVDKHKIVQVGVGKSYWSVITPGNSHQKINEIVADSSLAPGCK